VGHITHSRGQRLSLTASGGQEETLLYIRQSFSAPAGDNESHFIGQQTFQFQWLRLLDRQRVKLNDFPDT